MHPVFAANTIQGWLEDTLSLSPGWALGVAAAIHAFLVLNFFGLAPFVFIWAERKVSGRIQDRLGPTRVGGRFGWLHLYGQLVQPLSKGAVLGERAPLK